MRFLNRRALSPRPMLTVSVNLRATRSWKSVYIKQGSLKKKRRQKLHRALATEHIKSKTWLAVYLQKPLDTMNDRVVVLKKSTRSQSDGYGFEREVNGIRNPSALLRFRKCVHVVDCIRSVSTNIGEICLHPKCPSDNTRGGCS